MKQNIINVLGFVDEKLWIVSTILIVLVGLYFTIKLKGIQFNFKKMYKSITEKEKNKKGISSFKTLMLSLAGRIGVGSISGIALAIYIGGPGTIFWIWCLSLISSTLAYSETYLGVKYKEKDGENYKGGPAYYIKKALNMPRLGAIYAIIIVICYGIGIMSVQSNTITTAIVSIINVKSVIVGIILSTMSCFIIFGGLKKITDTTSKIVPFMSAVYVLVSLYIIVVNIELIPQIFKLIINSAFNFHSFYAGFLTTLLIGVERGIFSNEAGLGTGSIAASSGASNDAIKQGYIQMLGIYITSFFICTATSIIVLTSNYDILNISDPNGIEIATHSFMYHLGGFGNIMLVICVFLFAFSTILSGYYYGESSLKYFNRVDKKYINILKIITVLVIFLGSISSPTIVWNLVDAFVALTALINVYAIFKLRKKIRK